MSEAIWTTLIGGGSAIVVALLGFLGVIYGKKKMAQTKATKEHDDVVSGLRRLSDTYDVLDSIVEDTSTDRVVIFAGHNQGGVPRPHCGFWVSALHAASNSNQIFIKSSYQNIEVDSHYIQLLVDVERFGLARLKTEEMEASQLKSYYQLEGVKDSIVFFLGIKENKFLYLSSAKYYDSFTENEITTLKLKVNQVKNLINPD